MFHSKKHFLKAAYLWVFLCCFLGVSYTLFWELFSSQGKNAGTRQISFILDVSKSMNVVDIWWVSRLDHSKTLITDIVRDHPGGEFALSIFAGESQRVLPFSTDISLFSTFLWPIDHRNIVQQGSDIWWALRSALLDFNASDEISGTIVLLSDGSDDYTQISSELRKDIWDLWVAVVIIWVGTPQWWYIPTYNAFTPYEIYNWERVVSKLNWDSLKNIARSISGKYYDYDEGIRLVATENSVIDMRWKTSILLTFTLWWILVFFLYHPTIYSKRRYES